jgi:hypothetical protein
MNRLQLRLWLRVCHGALVLLGTLAALRLGYVAWVTRSRMPTYTPTPALANNPSPESLPLAPLNLIERLRLPAAPLPSELLQESASPQPTGSAAPKRPKPVRVYLVVNQEPARTEIRLNGVLLGQTPYVGEFTCTSGESLEFVLIPPRGAPRRSVERCDRTELLLTDPTH